MRGTIAMFVMGIVGAGCAADEEELGPDASTTALVPDIRRTVIFMYGETQPGQDMFLRGGLDHAKAKELLGIDCTPENLLCAIPIVHRNLRNATTTPWKAHDGHLDWYGTESGQDTRSEGTPADWTTATWSPELGPVRTVEVDGFGIESKNRFGIHYWMLDVDMDCSRGILANGARWFELKTFVSNGPGWEGDVRQPDAPYVSNNHFAQCGKINVFRRNANSARVYAIDATPPTSYRFVALGDAGRGDAGQHAVAAGIDKYCKARGCDFALMLGDNIYNSGASSVTDPQFQSKFELPYANLGFPFHVVLGNHDYGGGGAGNEPWKGQVEVDYTQRSRKWKLPSAFYRWTMVDTDLFALDTNSQMYQTDAAQRQTVGQWTGTSTAPWKIAYGHHPYRSNGSHGNAGRYDGTTGVFPWSGDGVKSFLDTTICGKVDLYLSGHDHNLQWLTDRCGGTTELLVSGAGSSGKSLSGSNPTRFQSSSQGFIAISVEGKTLTGEVVDAGGNVMFTRTLTKP